MLADDRLSLATIWNLLKEHFVFCQNILRKINLFQVSDRLKPIRFLKGG